MDEKSFPAHGGCGLIDRFVPESEREHFLQRASGHKSYTISNGDLSVFYRIADGTLSPLEGPMDRHEFYRVLDEEVIERAGKRYAWAIPLAFPIANNEANKLSVGEIIAVKNERGVIVGTLEISDIFHFDKQKYNRIVFGTERIDHPGPRMIDEDGRDYLLAGKIRALPQYKNPAFAKYLFSPFEARQIFKEKRWQRIVAFQTRNPLHRAHEYAIVYALEKLTKEGFFAGAVLNPLVGKVKSDDVPAEVRMRTYEVLIEKKLLGSGDRDEAFWKTVKYDFFDQVMLIALDMKMFYAGPKEAVMHAIYRQNLGFTDIIIGRKHADAPFDDGTPAWGDFDAQDKFALLKGELLIKPFKIGAAAYVEEIGRVALEDEFKKKGFNGLTIAGKELRQKLERGEAIDERIMRKDVADILREAYRYNIGSLRTSIKASDITWHYSKIKKETREKHFGNKGIVIWLTGLPCSGKSTIAVGLENALFNMGCNAFILDGDNIRHGLNRDLGFSPQEREENIRRIGEVAKLFADSGAIAITAFVSPYKKDRDNVRSLLPSGEFIEIFVEASLAACEKRDAKGLYKKARNGELKDFTGVSAPYEEPENPELVIDTEHLTEEQSVASILNYLKEKGYLLRA